jgi:hypothetical protein
VVDLFDRISGWMAFVVHKGITLLSLQVFRRCSQSNSLSVTMSSMR